LVVGVGWSGGGQSSRPARLQPVGELRERPLVVHHAELPDVAADLGVVLVGLADLRVCGGRGREVREKKRRSRRRKIG